MSQDHKKEGIKVVDYYFSRLEYYKNLRKGKGYNQTDFKKAQADVSVYLKQNKTK